LEGLDIKIAEDNTNSKTADSGIIDEIWQEARQAANLVLEKYSLEDLCEKRTLRRQLDIMYYI
jgi:DNA-binding IscR family transcriptional regulator